MLRLDFLKTILITPFINKIMSTNALKQLETVLPPSKKMPALFLGHGSPMNAIEENEFVTGFKNIATKLPTPTAILCVSAHWETNGTMITAMKQPKTIHDFGGFPKELFAVGYPAPGKPELAKEISELPTSQKILLDTNWGLDHGTWSVIKHLYPLANIPVLQLSLNYKYTPQQHADLAKQLNSLRYKGVLVVGSGNLVHNLGLVAWDKLNQPDYGYDWAIKVNQEIKKAITENNSAELIKIPNKDKEFKLAIPTPEHYLPILYAMALREKSDELTFFNDKALGGSLTMTSIVLT